MEPLREGETGATLQDVLALLDACDSFRSSSGESNESSSSSSPYFPTKPRRDESHSYYRTRNELQRLRQDAATLERRLTELQHNRASIYEQRLAELKALSAVVAKQRIERVQSEFQRRSEAERTNCQLKALLAKYVQMIHVMESAFAMISDADVALVFNTKGVLTQPNRRLPQDEQTLSTLADRLSRLELDVDSVVDRVIAEHSSTSCHSQRQFDADIAVVFESVISRPAACSLNQAHKAIVAEFTYHMAKRKVLVCDQQLSDTHETEVMQFQHEQQSFDLVDRARMRKLEQPGRVVYLRSAVVTIEGQDLSFTEDGVFLVIRNRSAGSILVGLHRIRVDQHDAEPAISDSRSVLNALKQRVVHWSCERNREFLSNMSKLLHERQQEIDISSVQV